jgi:hypothetical protein
MTTKGKHMGKLEGNIALVTGGNSGTPYISDWIAKERDTAS